MAQQMRVTGEANQGSLHGIFGVVLVARDGDGKPDEPLRSEVKQWTERIDAACREAVGTLLDECREIELASHLSWKMRERSEFVQENGEEMKN
jgi:hypothetical protein